MILKSLVLSNIRSYGEAPTRIDFDSGIQLFEGDIGSGKSTILYAIEFALFGLGESEAKSLLRVSADAGRVELVFEAEGRAYRVIRSIERKKVGASRGSPIQTRGWLSEESEASAEFAPTELKIRILGILKFRENPGRASSRIYRFAVFTPQELMREVLTQKSDERIDTLRRAFGIEDYSFARSNTETVVSELSKRSLAYSKASQGLKAKEDDLRRKKEDLESNERSLNAQETILRRLGSEISEKNARIESLREGRERIIQLEPIIKEIERSIAIYSSQLSQTRVQRELERNELEELERIERVVLPNLRTQHEQYSRAIQRVRELDPLLEERLSIERGIAEITRAIGLREEARRFQIGKLSEERTRLESQISSYDEKIRNLPAIIDEASKLSVEARDLPGLQGQLEELRTDIGAAEAILSSLMKDVRNTEAEIRALDGLTSESQCPLCKQKLTADHLKIVSEEFEGRILAKKKEMDTTQSRLSDLQRQVRSLEDKREKKLLARSKMEELEKQIAQAQQIQLIKNRTQEELAAKKEELAKLSSASAEITEEMKQAETELALLRSKREALLPLVQEQSKLKTIIARFEDARIQREFHTAEGKLATKQRLLEAISSDERRISELEKVLLERKREVQARREEMERGQPLLLEYARLQEEIEKLTDEFSATKTVVDQLVATTRIERENVASLDSEVSSLRRKAERASIYKGYSSWLETQFLPAIQEIESNVLAAINDEFNQVFQRWFAMLVAEEGDITVSVDDRFTPLVFQTGYELGVDSLSGGERTALALAYRLALNHMAKRANETAQTNLLILDEPTEGFSKEQIYRFRGVLQEIDCDQIVIVSHERDLESLADRVFRVDKVSGESTVSLLA